MKLKIVFLGVAIVLAGLFFDGRVHAQVDVVGGKVRIAVNSLQGPEGAAATQVLSADLKRTLLIDPSAGGKASQYTANGSMTAGSLMGRLVDRNGKAVVDKTYTGNWRHAAHQFADDITMAATGVPGFATSRVAFISANTGQKELYVMDIDGASVRQMTQDKTISNGPSWSRDGNSIAYTSYKSGYPDVYVIKLATGARTRVAYFPGMNSGPNFSPDGSTLALTLSKDGNPEIYTIPVGGGKPTRLTHTAGTETTPSWSPSGDRLVFSSDDRGSPQLFMMAAGGGEMARIFTNTPYNTKPDWSLDGKTIAYTMRQGGQFQVGVYRIDTKNAQTVTTAGGEDPSWTPNSRHLVYADHGGIYLLDTVTKLSTRLETGLKNCSEPAVTR
jgi:TolB protein